MRMTETGQVRDLVCLSVESGGNPRLLVWVPYDIFSNFSDSIQALFKEHLKQKSSESIK